MDLSWIRPSNFLLVRYLRFNLKVLAVKTIQERLELVEVLLFDLERA